MIASNRPADRLALFAEPSPAACVPPASIPATSSQFVRAQFARTLVLILAFTSSVNAQSVIDLRHDSEWPPLPRPVFERPRNTSDGFRKEIDQTVRKRLFGLTIFICAVGFAYVLAHLLRSRGERPEADETYASSSNGREQPQSPSLGEASAQPDLHLPAIADLDLMRSYPAELLQGARFRGGPNGLWLHFNRVALVQFEVANDWGYPGRSSSGVAYRASLSFEPGQTVRVIDAFAEDDGLSHDPSVRALAAQVFVFPEDAAVVVPYLPSHEAMQRLYNRTADDLAFWRAMFAAPDDELPRLVYADWLDDRGDPAAEILRDRCPFTLHGLVGVDGVWEGRNKQRANWQQVVSALRWFSLRGGMSDWSAAYSQFVLRRLASRPRQEAQYEWQGLSVAMSSRAPLPPFVAYLFFHLATAGCTRTAAGPGALIQSRSPTVPE